jgi:hypothetical protein
MNPYRAIPLVVCVGVLAMLGYHAHSWRWVLTQLVMVVVVVLPTWLLLCWLTVKAKAWDEDHRS